MGNNPWISRRGTERTTRGIYAVPGFFKWPPPVGHGAEAGGGVVERGDGGAAVGQEPPSAAAVGEGTGEVPGNGGVPVVLVGTGERARFQNELPDRGEGGGANQDGGRTTEGGGPQAGVIGEVAAERLERRPDAEHRNEEGDGEHAAERQEGRFDAEHRNEGRVEGGQVACSTAASGEGTGEVPGSGGVPVVLVGTGERARFQNELPDRGKEVGRFRAEGGGRRAEDRKRVSSVRSPRSVRRGVPTRSIGARARLRCRPLLSATASWPRSGGRGVPTRSIGTRARLRCRPRIVGNGEVAAERREGRSDAEHRHERGAVVGASASGSDY